MQPMTSILPLTLVAANRSELQVYFDLSMGLDNVSKGVFWDEVIDY